MLTEESGRHVASAVGPFYDQELKIKPRETRMKLLDLWTDLIALLHVKVFENRCLGLKTQMLAVKKVKEAAK